MFMPEHEEQETHEEEAHEEMDEQASESEEEASEESDEAKPAEEDEKESDDDEYDEITYNKEIVKIPKEMRREYLERGYNYDKVKGKLTDYEAKIDKISKLTGMDVDAVIAHLEEQQQAQAVSEYADTHGISEDEAKREFEREARLKAVEEREVRRDFAAAAEAEMVSLKEKPFFSDLEADIVAFVKDSMQPGKQPIMPAVVYKYFIGERFEELSAKDRSKTVKRTTADIQDKMKRGAMKSGDNKTDSALDAFKTDFGKKAAEYLGVDIAGVAKHIKERRKEFQK